MNTFRIKIEQWDLDLMLLAGREWRPGLGHSQAIRVNDIADLDAAVKTVSHLAKTRIRIELRRDWQDPNGNTAFNLCDFALSWTKKWVTAHVDGHIMKLQPWGDADHDGGYILILWE